jgi:hypothetical protein
MANLTDEALDFTISFNDTTKEVFYTDNLDYAADYNVPAATIRGLGQAFNPLTSALFIDKMSPAAALITDLNTATKESVDYALPLETDTGEIVQGAYSFLYAVYVPYTAVDQAVTSFSASNTIVIAGQDWSWLEAGDTFAVTLATTPANNGTKTVVSAIYNGSQTIVTVSTAITVEAGGSAVINFAINKTYSKTITQSFTGCTEVTPVLSIVSNCTSGQFGSITATDATVYGTQTHTNRVIQLYAPAGIEPAPTEDPWETTTDSQSALTVSELATGTWTAKLTADMSYTGSDGLVVTYSLSYPTNTFSHVVECSTGLCDLTSCIENFFNVLTACEAATPTQVLKGVKISYALAAYNQAQSCGDSDAMASYQAEIETLLGDSCTCSDSSSAPQWINNNSASGQTTIDELSQQVTDLTTTVNNYTYSTELLFNASWADTSKVGSWGQIVPFTIPKKYFEISTEAPYYQSHSYAEVIIHFKIGGAAADIVLYDQTNGVTLLDWNVGAISATGSGTLRAMFSSWDSLPALTTVQVLESPSYSQDENDLSGVATWDLDQDLLINILPTDTTAIIYAHVSVVGYRRIPATS